MHLVMHKHNPKTTYLRLKLLNPICLLKIDYILTDELIKCIYIFKSKIFLVIIKELLLFHSFKKIQKQI